MTKWGVREAEKKKCAKALFYSCIWLFHTILFFSLPVVFRRRNALSVALTHTWDQNNKKREEKTDIYRNFYPAGFFFVPIFLHSTAAEFFSTLSFFGRQFSRCMLICVHDFRNRHWRENEMHATRGIKRKRTRKKNLMQKFSFSSFCLCVLLLLSLLRVSTHSSTVATNAAAAKPNGEGDVVG